MFATNILLDEVSVTVFPDLGDMQFAYNCMMGVVLNSSKLVPVWGTRKPWDLESFLVEQDKHILITRAEVLKEEQEEEEQRGQYFK